MNHAFDIDHIRPTPILPNLLDGFTINRALKVTSGGRRFSLVFKRALWMSYEKRCAYCDDLIPNHKVMHVDHYVPLSKGGDDSIENFVCACGSCNTAKSNRQDIENLRASIRLRRSDLNGVISPSQLIALEKIGSVIPIPSLLFPFEARI